MQQWKKHPQRKKRIFATLKIDNELFKQDVTTHPDDEQWERAQQFGCKQKAISITLKKDPELPVG